MTKLPHEPDRWQIIPSSSARSELMALPEKVATAVFEFIDGPLRANPYRLGKELRGPLVGYRSARRGEYRVIYCVNASERSLQILHIMHRRDAYRMR